LKNTGIMFYIGTEKMEMFKLWLASLMSLFSYDYNGFEDEYRKMVRDVLNSLSDAYITSNMANIYYNVFVDTLLSEIEKTGG